MLYGFLYGGYSKDTPRARNTRDPCCVRQLSSSTITGHVRLWTNSQRVFAFRFHLWLVSSKYPANMSGPLNPLNKQNQEPATKPYGMKLHFVCSRSWFILGCSCVWWITNNKLQNICSEPLVWMIVGILFFLNIFRLQANWILRRFLAKHM